MPALLGWHISTSRHIWLQNQAFGIPDVCNSQDVKFTKKVIFLMISRYISIAMHTVC